MDNRKKSILHIVGFACVFAVIFMALEIYFFDKRDVSYTWERVQNVEDEIDVMLLGNSHGFTSTDMEVLDQLWGLNVESFASSSENMQQVMIHLEQALKHNKPKVIMLELYATLLESRDLLQDDRFGILLTDLDGMDSYVDKFQALMKTVPWNSIPEGMFQLLRPVNMWSRFDEAEKRAVKVDTHHGYQEKISYVVESNIDRDIRELEEKAAAEDSLGTLIDYNEEGLRAFLELTKENDIQVILYKAPLLRSSGSAKLNTVFQIAQEYDHVLACIDYREQMTDIGLELKDFYDEGHLNRMGAEKFTQYMSKDLEQLLEVESDWSNVWAYKSESIEELADGTRIYQMNNYYENTLYRFELMDGKELLDKQDFSKDNTYRTDVDIDETGYKLYCIMIPEGEEDGSTELCLQFMKKNDCVLEAE